MLSAAVADRAPRGLAQHAIHALLQAGLVLGLAALVAKEFPAFGTG
jgi:hypothetical protein